MGSVGPMGNTTSRNEAGRWWIKDWVALVMLSLVLAIDQISKLAVRSSMLPGQAILTWSPVQLTYVLNTGSAFGLFPGQTLFLVVASLIGVGVLFTYYRNFPKPPLLVKISLGMMLGGAIGNLIDRLLLGYVVDFIDVRFWPVFNLADSSITVGVAMLAYVLMLGRGK